MSGDICPGCLRKNFSAVYEDMKAKGLLTQRQIAEAEK